MDAPLRVLMVEDSEDDVALILRELRKGGYDPEHRRVESAADLESALARETWDVVITDHNLPGFSSAAAMVIIKNSNLDIPVIIVSGSIGESIAVEAMKNGAHDYIMKKSLARLAPAITRELRETRTRHAHRRAQETIEHLAYHDPLTGLGVYVYKLGGSAQVPPPPYVRIPTPQPPAQTATAEVLAKGNVQYMMNCGVCHGISVISGGVLPDLRRSGFIQNQVAFEHVVLKGSLRERGMIGFEQWLTPADAEAIRAYIIKEAWPVNRAEQAAQAAAR